MQPSSIETWKDALKLWRQDRDEESFIAYDGTKPVGWLKLNGLCGSGKAWISMLVVAPELRRRGYGARLVELACKRLAAAGFERVAVRTSEDNAPAQACYKKCSFAITEKSASVNGDDTLRVWCSYERNAERLCI